MSVEASPSIKRHKAELRQLNQSFEEYIRILRSQVEASPGDAGLKAAAEDARVKRDQLKIAADRSDIVDAYLPAGERVSLDRQGVADAKYGELIPDVDRELRELKDASDELAPKVAVLKRKLEDAVARRVEDEKRARLAEQRQQQQLHELDEEIQKSKESEAKAEAELEELRRGNGVLAAQEAELKLKRDRVGADLTRALVYDPPVLEIQRDLKLEEDIRREFGQQLSEVLLDMKAEYDDELAAARAGAAKDRESLDEANVRLRQIGQQRDEVQAAVQALKARVEKLREEKKDAKAAPRGDESDILRNEIKAYEQLMALAERQAGSLRDDVPPFVGLELTKLGAQSVIVHNRTADAVFLGNHKLETLVSHHELNLPAVTLNADAKLVITFGDEKLPDLPRDVVKVIQLGFNLDRADILVVRDPNGVQVHQTAWAVLGTQPSPRPATAPAVAGSVDGAVSRRLFHEEV